MLKKWDIVVVIVVVIVINQKKILSSYFIPPPQTVIFFFKIWNKILHAVILHVTVTLAISIYGNRMAKSTVFSQKYTTCAMINYD